jgi:hypothetical protein
MGGQLGVEVSDGASQFVDSMSELDLHLTATPQHTTAHHTTS